jgi:hypothetical protein
MNRHVTGRPVVRIDQKGISAAYRDGQRELPDGFSIDRLDWMLRFHAVAAHRLYFARDAEAV